MIIQSHIMQAQKLEKLYWTITKCDFRIIFDPVCVLRVLNHQNFTDMFVVAMTSKPNASFQFPFIVAV
jgi:hypothetical protein